MLDKRLLITLKMNAKPTKIAHRGLWRPNDIENTIQAFENAVNNKQKTHGIEVDLRELDTGELVIFHDDNLTRLTGKNLPLTSQSIKTPLKNNHVTRYIPTLEDFLKWLQTINHNQFIINIEFKHIKQSSVITVVKKVQEMQKNLTVFYSSFNQIIIETLIKETTAQIGFLLKTIEETNYLNNIDKNRIFVVTVEHNQETHHIIEIIKNNGLECGVYFSTLSDYTQTISKYLKNSKIDYIFNEETL